MPSSLSIEEKQARAAYQREWRRRRAAGLPTRKPPVSEEHKRAKRREYNRRWREKHREASNTASRRRQRAAAGALGATGETRAGVCPVCLKDGPLVLDHDHATGAVRGWLCRGCNAGLGLMGDTAAAAQRLVSYLVTHV